MDFAGNLYIADEGNNRIRKVIPYGIISTVAGTGTAGYSGDGGAATSAELYEPIAIAIDASGNLYIADTDNQRIRKVTAAGIISTVAGTGSTGSAGDGGPATSASLYDPDGIAVDGAGNLYIADQYNYKIRKVSSSGMISTVAGTGTIGFSGDGGPATGAAIAYAYGIAVDGTGNLYIGDGSNYRVRKVTYGDGLQVAAPVFSLAAGTYSSTQNLALSTSTPGASIYYTTDGTLPSAGSTLYTGSLTLSSSETVQAIAFANGYYTPSNVASAVCVIQ